MIKKFVSFLKSFFGSYPPGSHDDFMYNVGDTNYFDTFSDNVTLTTMQSLERQAEWLKKYNIKSVNIEGHCDPAEGSYEYCLALGGRRAELSKEYLSKFYKGNISTYSYGKNKPCTPLTGDYRNRRVVTIPQ